MEWHEGSTITAEMIEDMNSRCKREMNPVETPPCPLETTPYGGVPLSTCFTVPKDLFDLEKHDVTIKKFLNGDIEPYVLVAPQGSILKVDEEQLWKLLSDHHAHYQNLVVKNFGGDLYLGVVNSFNGEYYRIVYSDGDKEDLNMKELSNGWTLYRKLSMDDKMKMNATLKAALIHSHFKTYFG
jgi:hypothetical protein|tara:strand:- start:860 stop:1408 length:549 start_codon:yes stop_codon:yes gene_type:complete